MKNKLSNRAKIFLLMGNNYTDGFTPSNSNHMLFATEQTKLGKPTIESTVYSLKSENIYLYSFEANTKNNFNNKNSKGVTYYLTEEGKNHFNKLKKKGNSLESIVNE
ncbi:MAG: hypothetical protein GON13_03685 [Nanoarchaeota archaeon]|nr:hypothetical protein [Nanoarchaeota archaeon]